MSPPTREEVEAAAQLLGVELHVSLHGPAYVGWKHKGFSFNDARMHGGIRLVLGSSYEITIIHWESPHFWRRVMEAVVDVAKERAGQ